MLIPETRNDKNIKAAHSAHAAAYVDASAHPARSSSRSTRGRRSGLLLGLGLGLAAGLALVLLTRRKPTTLVCLDQLSLNALAGQWYELARGHELPDDPVGTRLEVELLADGSLSLRGSSHPGRFDAPADSCQESLRRESPGDPSGRLRTGRDQPVWLIELAADGSYCVAASPDRRRLWLMARSPELAPGIWQQVSDRLSAQGFAPERLIRTPHAAVPAVGPHADPDGQAI